MTKTTVLSFFVFMFSFSLVNAQTIEELTSQKAAKAAELAKLEGELGTLTGKVDALKGEVAALTEKLTPYPRWDSGLLGNLGLNFSNFNDWLSKDKPNTTAVNIGTSMNAFANADFEKSFWRNGMNLTLGWIKFDDKDVPDSEENGDFQVAADAFNITSLFGYKLSDKWAISTLGEYRTAVLDGKFNDPGYLDLGVGATWTPIQDLVVVIHPLNYNFVFSDSDFDFQSSLGAKVVADYTRKITKGVAWKSNLSAFLSYKDGDLSNWTWVNGFSTAVKGVGIGLDIGLRGNKQEALAAGKTDNPLQTYWLLGFSYNISSKK
ncbi:MAG TPA: DUF3078 domain-containing protein [Bacteroidetes bacterium]|nr:DUF3078 domain-containing protein [Bacteroidota bacterium]